MKKQLIVLLLFLAIGKLQAQVIEEFTTWNSFTVPPLLGVGLEEPLGWSGADSLIVGFGKTLNPFGTFSQQIFEETPGHGGSGSAMKVTTQFQDSISLAGFPAANYPGMATNSTIAIDIINNSFSLVGGTPVSYRPITTSMWVKNTVIGGDSTYIQAILIDDGDGADSIIAVADTAIGVNINSWTQVTLPLQYNGSTLEPTLIRYVITSGDFFSLLDTTNSSSYSIGTEIIVDDIEVSAPTGVSQYIYSSNVVSVYPTRFEDELHVNFTKGKFNSSTNFTLVDLNGRVVFKDVLEQELNVLSFSDLPKGNYIWLLSRDGQKLQSGKLLR